jgi:phage terminase large subunit-like protein
MDKLGYVLEDLSGFYSPNTWGDKVCYAYHKWKADRVVAEVNQGGDMVATIIRGIDPNISYKGVHATKGKRTRAEPVAALYEQSRVKHFGSHAGLETQMTAWDARSEKSPDRVDAMVWGMTELMLKRNDDLSVDWD